MKKEYTKEDLQKAFEQGQKGDVIDGSFYPELDTFDDYFNEVVQPERLSEEDIYSNMIMDDSHLDCRGD